MKVFAYIILTCHLLFRKDRNEGLDLAAKASSRGEGVIKY